MIMMHITLLTLYALINPPFGMYFTGDGHIKVLDECVISRTFFFNTLWPAISKVLKYVFNYSHSASKSNCVPIFHVWHHAIQHVISSKKHEFVIKEHDCLVFGNRKVDTHTHGNPCILLMKQPHVSWLAPTNLTLSSSSPMCCIHYLKTKLCKLV